MKRRFFRFFPRFMILPAIYLLAGSARASAADIDRVSDIDTLSGRGREMDPAAAYDLIKRIIPKEASHFEVAYIPQEDGKDVFELESRNGKVVLSGNNGVSVASAFNYYLKNYAHCDVTWNGTNLNLPDPLPVVAEKIHRKTPHTYRYYLNYTTYTLVWWDWARWEKEIDWMALNGINMPLAVQGQNIVWDKVYRSLGFTDKDMHSFFTGPSWFIWFWMGNMDGWGGPLPESWMKSHEALEKKILARERELGMKPVLQAFTGHVPPTFKDRFPRAKLRKTNWEGRFADTYILDPSDSMFTVIGKKFLTEETERYGTDHLYSADVFNEMVPPSSDSTFLNDINRTVYQSMSAVDPQAIWVMQGWLFVDKEEFWKPTQVKALLNAVPDGKLIVLDLFADERPVWNRTEAYYGKPWIWCMLHNFGGRPGLFGNMDSIATMPSRTLHGPGSGRMSGIGIAPEGIEQNPVIYDLMLENVWQDEPVDLDKWLRGYLYARYGRENSHATAAWDILRKTVYNVADNSNNAQSIITGRPTFKKSTDWTFTDISYDPLELTKAWENLLAASDSLKDNDGYRYDLVDVTRQVLANYANNLQQDFARDYKNGDAAAFRKKAGAFLQLISDLDRLLKTRKDFLLGDWLSSAKRWATNDQERKQYESNARDLVSLWADKDCALHEYAFRQWAGMLNGFYKPRWQQFIAYAGRCMETHKKLDQDGFDNKMKDWEWKWVNGHEPYQDTPEGDAVTVTREMYRKYAAAIRQSYADRQRGHGENHKAY